MNPTDLSVKSVRRQKLNLLRLEGRWPGLSDLLADSLRVEDPEAICSTSLSNFDGAPLPDWLINEAVSAFMVKLSDECPYRSGRYDPSFLGRLHDCACSPGSLAHRRRMARMIVRPHMLNFLIDWLEARHPQWLDRLIAWFALDEVLACTKTTEELTRELAELKARGPEAQDCASAFIEQVLEWRREVPPGSTMPADADESPHSCADSRPDGDVG